MSDRTSILEAKRLLPMTVLLDQVSPGWRKKNPIREDDRNNSFSATELGWKDHGSGDSGDQITFLEKVNGFTRGEAIAEFLAMAGINSSAAAASMPSLIAPIGALNGSAAHPKRETAVYDYHDMAGNVAYQVVRYEPKDFRQRRIVDGQLVWNLTGITRVLYRLPEVLKAEKVWVVEGEKDAEALAACGHIATCNAGGAGKWQESYTECLRGKEVIISGDNDEPGRKHVAQISAALSGVAGKVRLAPVPAPHKDISDYLNADAASEHEAGTKIEQLLQQAQDDTPCATKLGDITCDTKADPTELLKNRFLCRGGGSMLLGPTGIGKSSFAMQAAVLWSIGKPCFGIEPVKPLTSLIVQAENDDGDLVEMREGVFAGLGLTEDEKCLARKRIFVRSENSMTGAALVTGLLRPLLGTHRPDLLWLDNLFAYCGCNVSDQEKITTFLRTLLNPLIAEFQCGLVVTHHTNKPPSGEQKAEWKDNEFSYLGSGTNELANWPRAILAIRALKTAGVFELVAPKRGYRVGWTDTEGKRTQKRTIAHANDGLIYWRDAGAEEIPVKAGPKTRFTVDHILSVLAGRELGTVEWQKRCKTEKGIGPTTFYDLKGEAEIAKRIFQSEDTQKWMKLV